jgi:hypothetical protein
LEGKVQIHLLQGKKKGHEKSLGDVAVVHWHRAESDPVRVTILTEVTDLCKLRDVLRRDTGTEMRLMVSCCFSRILRGIVTLKTVMNGIHNRRVINGTIM